MPKMAQPDLDYVAPEMQSSAAVSPQSDMFSLGLLICSIFNNGRSPIEANFSTATYFKSLESVSIKIFRCPSTFCCFNHEKFFHFRDHFSIIVTIFCSVFWYVSKNQIEYSSGECADTICIEMWLTLCPSFRNVLLLEVFIFYVSLILPFECHEFAVNVCVPWNVSTEPLSLLFSVSLIINLILSTKSGTSFDTYKISIQSISHQIERIEKLGIENKCKYFPNQNSWQMFGSLVTEVDTMSMSMCTLSSSIHWPAHNMLTWTWREW